MGDATTIGIFVSVFLFVNSNDSIKDISFGSGRCVDRLRRLLLTGKTKYKDLFFFDLFSVQPSHQITSKKNSCCSSGEALKASPSHLVPKANLRLRSHDSGRY